MVNGVIDPLARVSFHDSWSAGRPGLHRRNPAAAAAQDSIFQSNNEPEMGLS